MRSKTSIVLLSFVVFSLFLAFEVGAESYEGSLQVYLSPSTAISDGAQWKIKNGEWKNSGDILEGISTNKNGQSKTIYLKEIDGWQSVKSYNVIIKPDVLTQSSAPAYTLESGGEEDPPSAELTLPNWPLWPIPTDTPNYWDGPLSFTYLNRDSMAYVRFDMVGNDQGDSYYNSDLWWGDTGIKTSKVWGSHVILLKTVEDEILEYTAQFPLDRAVYVGHGSNPSDLTELSRSEISDMLQSNSIIPIYSSDWFLVASDDYWENQLFSDNEGLLDNWVDFLISHSSKNGQAMEDSGHASPVIAWPDNTWIKTMANYEDYEALLESRYAAWGGSLILLPTNEGLLHAFTNVYDDKVEEKWSFMPTPALQLGVYKEYLKNLAGVSDYPRVPLLEGPIVVGDIETNGTWKRILIGTTGLELNLRPKENRAWGVDEEYGEELPSTVQPLSFSSGDLFGLYALDITDPDNPEELWSVSGTSWNGDEMLNVNGTRTESSQNRVDYGYCFDIRMVLSKPLLGYTRTGENDEGEEGRLWHVLLAGIDDFGEYHLWDIEAETGKIIQHKQLPGPASSETHEDDYILQEMQYPTRIAAALPMDESTPLLSEVYVHFANGDFYRWNVASSLTTNTTDNDSNPKNLIHFTTKYGSDPDWGAASLNDFDMTWIKIGGVPHRFLAFTIQIEKRGEWLVGGGGDHNVLLVVDLTDLETTIDNDEDRPYPYWYEPDPRHGSGGWGLTNEYLTDEFGGHLWMALDQHMDQLDVIGAPIFYDGKIVFATGGESDHGNAKGTYTRMYIIDPSFEGSPVYITSGQNVEIEGGALIDEQGRLIAPTSEGTMVLELEDYGLQPIGSSSSNIESGIMYWKVD